MLFRSSQTPGAPAEYTINGANGQPIDLRNINNFSLLTNQGSAVKASDKESYFHLDGDYRIEAGWLTNVKVGVRQSKHDRTYDVIGARWNAQDNAAGPIPSSSADYPFTAVTGGTLIKSTVLPSSALPVPATSYPANWFNGASGNFPRDIFRFNMDQMKAFTDKYINWDPARNQILTSGYAVKEENSAAYAMGEFELDPSKTGNFGVRLVKTRLDSLSYQALTAAQCAVLQPCTIPEAIVGSRYATYIPRLVSTENNAVLPSLNVRWQLDKQNDIRLGISRSLGRANYNELAGAVSLNDTLLTGSSGNPKLKPILSNNVDLSWSRYFAPRAYVSAGVFAQNLENYVKTGTSSIDYFNIAQNKITTYLVTSRIGVSANLKGAEAAMELPLTGGFGLGVNGTYVDSKDVDGAPLLGTSTTTYNLRGFYEDDKITASLAWNYRSDYAIGFVGDGTLKPLVNTSGVITQYNGQHRYAGAGSLSISLGYRLTKDVSVHFDGNNLNDPIRHTYYINANAPGYWHQNGRQYFLAMRAKI